MLNHTNTSNAIKYTPLLFILLLFISSHASAAGKGKFCDFGSTPGYNATKCQKWCNNPNKFTKSTYRTRCCSRSDVCYDSSDANDSNYGACQTGWCPAGSGGGSGSGSTGPLGGGNGSVPNSTSILSDEPLFVSIDVDPNVFIELDDSGSMDWEILTVPYYHACSYDKNNPRPSTFSECSGEIITNGNWRGVYNTNGNNYEFLYIFNNSDNFYNRVSLYQAPWLTSVPTDPEERNRYLLGYKQRIMMWDWRVKSSSFNVLYFNPKVDYKPWVESKFPLTNSTPLAKGDYTSVRSNPVSLKAGYSVQKDLDDINTSVAGDQPFVFEVWLDNAGYSGSAPSTSGSTNRTLVDNNQVDLWDEHVRYTVTSSGIDWVYFGYDINASGDVKLIEKSKGTLGLTDIDNNDYDGDGFIDGSGKTTLEIIQNIANWYQYSRRRTFAARSAIATVINKSPDIRFGLGYIKKPPYFTYTSGGQSFNTRVPFPAASVTNYANHNDQLLENMYYSNYDQFSGRSGTPLRRGLTDVGNYFGKFGLDSSLNDNPIVQSCQHNFAILFSDGHYNNGNLGVADWDGNGTADTLADVAYAYYTLDLDRTFANDVIRPNHPNANSTTNKTHQHMVTFPVSFGLEGLLKDTDDDGLPDFQYNTATNAYDKAFTPAVTETWATISGVREDPAKIDDMWHAAYNSGGLFISASTPEQLVDGLENIIDSVNQTTASSAALAASSGEVRNGSLVFQVFFDSSDWSGNVKAVEANAQGQFVNQFWTNNGASGELDNLSPNNRVIITRAEVNQSGNIVERGVPFRWTNLSTAQKSKLNNDSQLLDYLRGAKSNEGVNLGQFRVRQHLLGDIINSAPFFVGAPFENYPSGLNGSGTTSYQSFRNTYGDTVASNGTVTYGRKRMIYTAANDGMLHGFSIDDNGKELLAYVPSMVYDKLSFLSLRSYKHRYILDGAPVVADAYSSVFNGWKSVLVAGMGAGGAGIYALDVTNPSNFSEANASDISLWEFDRVNTAGAGKNANGDSDLGYTMGIPTVAMMNDGSWVAVFGNGYHNHELGGDGSAAVYIVDIATGGLLHKFDTPNTHLGGKNGMSSPALIDANGDHKIDYIYAGDLAGNMWKLDVTSTSSTNWKFAFGTPTAPVPLFKALSGQPITTRPEVMRHPTSQGFIVLFGTGKFMDNGDNTSTGQTTQSFYGVWDKNDGATTSRNIDPSKLLEQEIIYEGTHSFLKVSGTGSNTVGIRITSDKADNAKYKIDWSVHKGWKLNFNYSGNTGNLGERQITNSVLRDGSILFTTVMPTPEACTPGGTSWLMELDATDGSRLKYPPFDLNGDKKFDKLDMTYGNSYDNLASSGISKTQQGIYSAPLNLPNKLTGSDKCVDSTLLSTSQGNILDFSRSCVGSKGRQSWRYLDID